MFGAIWSPDPKPSARRHVLGGMSTLYIAIAANGNEQVVHRPRATDAIGAALRGVFGNAPALPDDMARLLRGLERR